MFKLLNSNIFKNKKKPSFKIDMVYLWCDLNDENFRKKKAEFEKCCNIESNANGECRYKDNDELKYSLRSLEKYANWINKIYIVTDKQVPKWLNTNNKRIKIIDHNDIMPSDALPSFNSNAIEHCITNIPELSELFVYGNDDMFFSNYVDKSFFFSEDGYPIIRHVKKHKNMDGTIYGNILKNTKQLFFDKFKKEYDIIPHHCIDAYKKSDLIKCYEAFKTEIDGTIRNHFRTQYDVQRNIYNYFALYSKHGTLKRSSFSFLFYKRVDTYVCPLQKEGIEKKVKQYKPKLLCLNDCEAAQDADRINVKSLLERLFPDKSEFEI